MKSSARGVGFLDKLAEGLEYASCSSPDNFFSIGDEEGLVVLVPPGEVLELEGVSLQDVGQGNGEHPCNLLGRRVRGYGFPEKGYERVDDEGRSQGFYRIQGS